MDVNDPNGVRLGAYWHPIFIRKTYVERLYGGEYFERKQHLYEHYNLQNASSNDMKEVGMRFVRTRHEQLQFLPSREESVYQMYRFLLNHQTEFHRELYEDMIIVEISRPDQVPRIEFFLSMKWNWFLRTLRETSHYAYRPELSGLLRHREVVFK